MAIDKGLPPVPSGLSRPLSAYLHSLHACVTRLVGVARGSTDAQAVRQSDKREFTRSTTQPIADSSVGSSNLKDSAVTTRKIASEAVTGEKIALHTIKGSHIHAGEITQRELAASSISESALQNASVGTDHLQDGAVTEEKLEVGILPVFIQGISADGETITLPGPWARQPIITMTGLSCPSSGGTLFIGTENARQNESGDWQLDVLARTSSGGKGSLQWLAVGHRKLQEADDAM